MKKLLLLILNVVLVVNLYAGEVDSFFMTGNKFYQDGDFESAVVEYEKIIQRGYENWQAYYNLGNAYYKLGETGKAILNYERAKRLNPKNEDIVYNLQLVNLQIADRIQKIPEFFLTAWIFQIANLLALPAWGTIFLIFYIAIIALFILRMLLNNFRFARTFSVSLILIILLCSVSGILVLRIYESETFSYAVVLTDKVDVKSAPDDSATDVFTLHEGVKVEIKDASLHWVKIRLADGKIGWLNQGQIERI